MNDLFIYYFTAACTPVRRTVHREMYVHAQRYYISSPTPSMLRNEATTGNECISVDELKHLVNLIPQV